LLVGVFQLDCARVSFSLPANYFRTVLAVKGSLRRNQRRVPAPLVVPLTAPGRSEQRFQLGGKGGNEKRPDFPASRWSAKSQGPFRIGKQRRLRLTEHQWAECHANTRHGFSSMEKYFS